MSTALEIFTNPNDIEITVGQDSGGNKFAIGIFRDPGHNFKPLLTSQPFAKSQEEAIEVVRDILYTVHKVITSEFGKDSSLASQYLNPNGREIDQSKILNQDLIARILEELRQHQKASTYKMFATAT